MTDSERQALRVHPERLRAVQATGLLDTPPDASFDALTQLAAALLEVPIAFVSLVDEARDFYISSTGFPEPLLSTRQLDGLTLCHHVIAHEAPLVIGDTLADPIFAAVPTVQRLGVRAYAGVALLLDGHAIGSFCAIDIEPRAWSARDVRVLEEFAASFSREVALRRALKQAVRGWRASSPARSGARRAAGVRDR